MTEKIESIEEMETGELYSYGNPDENYEKGIGSRQTFRFERNPDWERVTLSYKDGYVANPPEENLKRHISEGRVYKAE